MNIERWPIGIIDLNHDGDDLNIADPVLTMNVPRRSRKYGVCGLWARVLHVVWWIKYG